MNIPYWLLKLLPMWGYICPKCGKEVDKNSHECPSCSEHFPFPLKVPPKVLKDRKALEKYVHEKIFPKIASWQREYLTQFFTEIFSDDFESGVFVPPWSSVSVGGGNTLEIIAAGAHHGSLGVHAKTVNINTAAYCRQNITAAPIVYNRGYYKFVTLPTSGTQDFPISELWYNSYTNSIAAAVEWYLGAAVWILFDYVGGVQHKFYSTTSPVVGTWYCVEILRDVTNGRSKLWVEGVLLLDVAEAHSGNNNIVTHGMVYTYMTNCECYFDCVVVADIYIGVEEVAGQPYISRVQRIPGMMTWGGNH